MFSRLSLAVIGFRSFPINHSRVLKHRFSISPQKDLIKKRSSNPRVQLRSAGQATAQIVPEISHRGEHLQNLVYSLTTMLQKNQFGRAMQSFEYYRKTATDPDHGTLRIAEQMLSGSQMSFALAILDTLPRTLENFNKMLALFVKAQFSNAAMRVAQAMQDAGVKPDESTYLHLMRLLERDTNLRAQAMTITKKALEEFAQSSTLLEEAVACMAVQRFGQEVTRLRAVAAERGIRFHPRVNSILLNYYATNHDVASVLEIFNMMREGRQVLYPFYQSAALRLFVDTNQTDAALALYNYHTKTLGLPPSARMVAYTVRSMATAKRLDDGLSVYSDLHRNRIHVTSECLIALIVLFARCNKIDRAIELLSRVPDLKKADATLANEPKAPKTRGQLEHHDLGTLIRSCNRDEAKLKSLASACLKNKVIDSKSCALFVQEYKELNNASEALAFFDQMVALGYSKLSVGLVQALMSMTTADPKRTLALYALLKVKATTPAIVDYVKRACEILDDDGYSAEEIAAMRGDNQQKKEDRNVKPLLTQAKQINSPSTSAAPM